MMTFLEWNDAIAGHFFRPSNAGHTVYLYVTRQLLDELGAPVGDTCSHFVTAMQAGPSWATRTGLCQKALQSMTNWRSRHLVYPPYIGYLALFVLAAGHEADFASHAYYPRLRELLGEPPAQGQYPSFQRMLELWSDLEHWAGREKQGALGILRLDIAGAWLHVGLPVAQTLLTETEREYLQNIFADAGFDPDDPPSDMELARTIRARGAGHLRHRTLQALAHGQLESEYTAILLDRVLEELDSWVEVSASSETGPSGPLRGALVFCLRLDPTARRADFQLHLRLRNARAERIVLDHDGVEYTCRILGNGFSTALLDSSHRPLDGGRFDWQQPIVLSSLDGQLVLRSPSSSVRVFADGSQLGVAGFLGTRLLDPRRPFAVATSAQLSADVRAWGAASCADFREHDVAGLPSGWTLFTASSADDDSMIRDRAPQLAFARRLRRARLEGGLRIPGTQYFFRFAPPLVRLYGASESVEVRFNDSVLVSRDTDGTFSIPDDLLTEDTVAVTCNDAGIVLRRLIYLRDQLHASGAGYDLRCYTSAGSSADVTLGPHLICGVPAAEGLQTFVASPLVALGPDHHAVLLGHRLGEIALYNPRALPEWQPVWAVLYHRRVSTAYYVGLSALPPDRSHSGTPRTIRKWKDILWHQRKRIHAPTFEPARALWLTYQHVARNA
jgi:hypothetical protein